MATSTRIAPVGTERAFDIQWSAIFAGAVAASALAFILHAFAGAIGISLSSAAPTWRDASFALILLSGLYLILVALASYAFGAFVAARVRAPVVGTADDIEFRDGMHGLIVWALATLLTGLLAIALVQATPRLAVPSASGPSTSVAGENIIAYDLDRLFRSERRPQGARLGTDGLYLRRNGRSGTFLPQVAAETGWSREEFFGHCARDKAGIGWDGWRDAELYVYQALVIAEHAP